MRAVATLERGLGCRDYEVLPGNILRIFDYLTEPQTVTAALAEAGVPILGIENRGSNLEDYFMALIGGGQHA